VLALAAAWSRGGARATRERKWNRGRWAPKGVKMTQSQANLINLHSLILIQSDPTT